MKSKFVDMKYGTFFTDGKDVFVKTSDSQGRTIYPLNDNHKEEKVCIPQNEMDEYELIPASDYVRILGINEDSHPLIRQIFNDRWEFLFSADAKSLVLRYTYKDGLDCNSAGKKNVVYVTELGDDCLSIKKTHPVKYKRTYLYALSVYGKIICGKVKFGGALDSDFPDIILDK